MTVLLKQIYLLSVHLYGCLSQHFLLLILRFDAEVFLKHFFKFIIFFFKLKNARFCCRYALLAYVVIQFVASTLQPLFVGWLTISLLTFVVVGKVSIWVGSVGRETDVYFFESRYLPFHTVTLLFLGTQWCLEWKFSTNYCRS